MKRLFVVALLLFAACDVFSGPETTEPLTEDALLDHLNYLAGDSLYGRGSGSEYELQAAEYIRDAFDDVGLVPPVAGWFQSFTYEANPNLAPPTETVDFAVGFGSGWTGLLGTSDVGASNVVQPRQQVESQNVLGVLPGQGSLSGQWVIVGAHYDHIGFSRVSPDSIIIFNGADDNASGTALLLELAGYLGHYFTAGVSGSSDRRSLMFQAYGSEEAGLRGSRYFVENPTMPLDSITAMVNLDMVGRLRDGHLFALGASSSPLWEQLLTEHNEDDLQLITPPNTTGRSDHAPFYERLIPVLFFYTGTHDEYHAPEDDVWLLNTTGMVSIGNLAIAVITELLERSDPPAFTP
jgi:hypothetical protein